MREYEKANVGLYKSMEIYVFSTENSTNVCEQSQNG